MSTDDHDLRDVLHDEAGRHHPDRDAMLERIHRGRTRRSGRPVAAALAVAAVVAIVAAVRLPGTTGPVPPTAGVPRPVQEYSAPSPVREKGLEAVGKLDPHSFASWSQQQVTLATRERITRLDVTIRIARGEGVADTGRWTSIPAEMVTTSVAVEPKALVYRFTLDPGGTLAPGSYVFAAQFNHTTSHPLAGDSFRITAGATTLRGGFTG
ncbi:hypothetical protein KOI35_23145 [Actinoplanes bogorensis]|uniref:Uncharacterized protein n=1 Tax=Paractinoplanes bogorensis TaxID=1610840 RepID=A0ABS5YWB6_9ACTN|nr:hypothetical protein [Actinoplanes bogorensis]MBU2666405.1 hypothetical protein [Actinoplanes bogorensis]